MIVINHGWEVQISWLRHSFAQRVFKCVPGQHFTMWPCRCWIWSCIRRLSKRSFQTFWDCWQIHNVAAFQHSTGTATNDLAWSFELYLHASILQPKCLHNRPWEAQRCGGRLIYGLTVNTSLPIHHGPLGRIPVLRQAAQKSEHAGTLPHGSNGWRTHGDTSSLWRWEYKSDSPLEIPSRTRRLEPCGWNESVCEDESFHEKIWDMLHWQGVTKNALTFPKATLKRTAGARNNGSSLETSVAFGQVHCQIPRDLALYTRFCQKETPMHRHVSVYPTTLWMYRFIITEPQT